MTMRPSPIVALNRAIAIAQAEGPEWGLEEMRLITDCNRLAAYPFHSAAVGELELRRGRHDTAREHFRAALALARNPTGRRLLVRRLGASEPEGTQRAYYEQFWETHFEAEDRIWGVRAELLFGCPGASHDHPIIAGSRVHLALDVRA